MTDKDITTARQRIENALADLLPAQVLTGSVRSQLTRIATEAISEATEFAEPAATVFRGKSKATVSL